MSIPKLIAKARKAYITYQSLAGDADCGAALLQHISPRAAEAAREFDDAMTELVKLDPNCPKFTPLSV